MSHNSLFAATVEQVTELIRHGQIRTTKVKAKAIRPYAEHMITLAKDGSLHAFRQVGLGCLPDTLLAARR
jgi:large subunit ribosomal protein L17